MSSTFFGLEIGSRALKANQLALDVTGHNTSNVGTPGYSRQVAEFEATVPYGAPGVDGGKPSQIGTGVAVAGINRVRNQYLDTRINGATSDQAALASLRDILSRVETAYGEPSSSGIGSRITALFGSFSDLSATPESGGVRATVLNRAQALVTAFHSVSSGLAQISPDIQGQISASIGEVNNISSQIAALNKQIGASLANGDHPNDLLDKRTALVNQLSGFVDVQVIDTRNSETNQPTGQIQINVGGFTLVQTDSSTPLPVTQNTQNGAVNLQTSEGQAIPLHGGSVFGLIKATTLLSGYQADLNTLASNVIGAVNSQHAAGYGLDGATGRPFFTGTGASDIDVSSTVSGNLDAVVREQ